MVLIKPVSDCKREVKKYFVIFCLQNERNRRTDKEIDKRNKTIKH